MRILAAIPCLVFVGAILGGCNTGAPQGVLPRDPVPPPPSLSGATPRQTSAARQSGAPAQRRAIDVPDRIETPRPASPAVEPVMTPSGAGAGFRF
jgi:hypothetical protein